MGFDVAIGQYVEGKSLLHRLDPRFKIVGTILYIVAVFLARNLWSFGLLSAFSLVMILLSGVPLRILLRSMRPLLFIALFTAVLNIFWLKGETLLLQWWIIEIYLEGLINAGLLVLRIMLLLLTTGVMLTYTTTPIALTDGLEQLLSPLKVFHLPVHEFSMMMTIALRFIPTLTEETEKIMNAQKARGADFSSGGLIRRAKALLPILVPLFVSAFRRADELATAMECRCYIGGEGRTRMNVLHAKSRDFLFVLSILVLGAGLVLANQFLPGYSLA
ncbi:MAG: energy-coupling factor transporter transmembrane protein EcfT [Clostridia bacterium]|nr:energy-coupling factor transporter transmembrane protein EcfT [Clostridia bacterium]